MLTSSPSFSDSLLWGQGVPCEPHVYGPNSTTAGVVRVSLWKSATRSARFLHGSAGRLHPSRSGACGRRLRARPPKCTESNSQQGPWNPRPKAPIRTGAGAPCPGVCHREKDFPLSAKRRERHVCVKADRNRVSCEESRPVPGSRSSRLRSFWGDNRPKAWHVGGAPTDGSCSREPVSPVLPASALLGSWAQTRRTPTARLSGPGGLLCLSLRRKIGWDCSPHRPLQLRCSAWSAPSPCDAPHGVWVCRSHRPLPGLLASLTGFFLSLLAFNSHNL